MAREEEVREDLLREATALVARVELKIKDFEEPIVAGFRRDGAASFFFGQQVVYQFNTAGELRRGFLDERLYKAECGRLVRLTRERTVETVNLVRHELDAEETLQFIREARQRLQKLHDSLRAADFQIEGQIPVSEDVVERVRTWLAALPAQIRLADSPRVA